MNLTPTAQALIFDLNRLDAKARIQAARITQDHEAGQECDCNADAFYAASFHYGGALEAANEGRVADAREMMERGARAALRGTHSRQGCTNH